MHVSQPEFHSASKITLGQTDRHAHTCKGKIFQKKKCQRVESAHFSRIVQTVRLLLAKSISTLTFYFVSVIICVYTAQYTTSIHIQLYILGPQTFSYTLISAHTHTHRYTLVRTYRHTLTGFYRTIENFLSEKMLRKLQESSNMTIGKSIDTEKCNRKKIAGRP